MSSTKIPIKKIPQPSGKENVRPSALATGKKVPSMSNETVYRPRVSFSYSQDDRKKEAGAAREHGHTSSMFPLSSASKRTHFHVHSDDQILAGSTATKRDPHEGSYRNSVATAMEPISQKQLEPRIHEQLGKITRQVSEDRSMSEEQSDGERPPPSKIPRFSKILAKGKGNECQLKNRGTRASSMSAATPADVLPPPLQPSVPLKAAIRRNKFKAAIPNEAGQLEVKEGYRQRDSVSIPLFCHTEYHDNLPVVEYERERRSPQLSANFLTRYINTEQRRLVVTFMMHLGTHCRYPSYIVYQAVKLFDAITDRMFVETAFIQLTALACLWIALKKQENFHKIPAATTMVALAKELYLGREDLLIAYEKRILQVMDFQITFADPFTLFGHHLISCIQHIQVSDKTATYMYYCGCYLIDITLLDEQFCRTSISLVSLTVTELVLGLVLDTVVVEARPRWLFWRDLLFTAVPYLLHRFENEDINRTRVAILRRVLISGKKQHGFEVVHKKYIRRRNGGISKPLLERANMVSSSETLFDV